MQQHIRIIGILDYVFGGLGIFLGVIFGVLFTFGASTFTQMQRGGGGLAALFASIGIVGALIIIAISVFEIFVGINLQQYKSWARTAQTVLAILGILSFPIGTAFGVYVLWVLFNSEIIPLFKS
jgi:hypothetical protein